MRTSAGPLDGLGASIPARPQDSGVRRRTVWIIAVTALVAALLLPMDAWLSHSISSIWAPGDVEHTMKAAQEYGGVGTMAVTIVIIWLLDPARRRRVADWIVAAALAWGLSTIIHILTGRLRPGVEDASGFLWLWGTYPMPLRDGTRVAMHSWQLGGKDLVILWSMPSGHATLAAVMSVFLVALYPRLRPLAITMVVVVCVARVWFAAHYPSDVVVGVGLGVLCTRLVLAKGWGVGLTELICPSSPRAPGIPGTPGAPGFTGAA